MIVLCYYHQVALRVVFKYVYVHEGFCPRSKRGLQWHGLPELSPTAAAEQEHLGVPQAPAVGLFRAPIGSTLGSTLGSSPIPMALYAPKPFYRL